MRLRARERWKLRQIEGALRKDAPGLDALLAGRPRHGPPAFHALTAAVMATYLVPPALLIAGLVVNTTWLIVAGAALCPFIPLAGWLLIHRRSFTHGGPRHGGSSNSGKA